MLPSCNNMNSCAPRCCQLQGLETCLVVAEGFKCLVSSVSRLPGVVEVYLFQNQSEQCGSNALLPRTLQDAQGEDVQHPLPIQIGAVEVHQHPVCGVAFVQQANPSCYEANKFLVIANSTAQINAHQCQTYSTAICPLCIMQAWHSKQKLCMRSLCQPHGSAPVGNDVVHSIAASSRAVYSWALENLCIYPCMPSLFLVRESTVAWQPQR